MPEGQRDPRDRLERVNRSIYEFNDVLDRDIAVPVTKAYVKITPDPVETGVSNFFQNLTYPYTVVNDGLQLKPKPFLQSVARLLVNTTLGIGGLFDPATQLGIPTGDEDFGQTLGYWHVPARSLHHAAHTGPQFSARYGWPDWRPVCRPQGLHQRPLGALWPVDT